VKSLFVLGGDLFLFCAHGFHFLSARAVFGRIL
jgi:hypothetical protein